jgi:nifR3 family TIM-barrel protein
MNIWQQLVQREQPILALSPMDGLTNLPMRLITKKYGEPDLMFTEFVNVEGLFHARERLLPLLATCAEETPVIAQIYGTTPELFYQAAYLVCELGFAGIDLNMGCPARNVVSNGAGAGLIKDPKLAAEIFRQTRAAAIDYAGEHGGEPLPVSIKTRLGYHSSEEMRDWLVFLLDLEPAVISLHGRTFKQQYTGEANWEKIAEAVELAKGSRVVIIGNGDIKSYQQAQSKITQSGVAGVLIGRAAVGNPFVFKDQEANYVEMAKIALEHCQLYEQLMINSERHNFLPMRTQLAAYIRGFPNAAKVRSELMQSNSSTEVAEILRVNELIL